MDLQASLLRNKSQIFAVNIFEITTFSTKHIFDETSCIKKTSKYGESLLCYTFRTVIMNIERKFTSPSFNQFCLFIWFEV